MILQLLNREQSCDILYHNGELEKISDHNLKNYSCVWKHHPILHDENYTYLCVLAGKKSVEEYSDSKSLYLDLQNQIRAHKKASITAKVSLEEFCFYDLIPEHTLKKWLETQKSCLEKIYAVEKKGEDYNILHKAHVLVENISTQNVSYGSKKGKVKYDIFGSATGRLTTKKGSVPILTLKKSQRKLLEPQNDAFVELDLNAAEVRMLIALSDQEQPQGDIHEWVAKQVFNDEISRSQAKVELFAWLYNPSNSKSRFDKIFSRQIFRDFFNSEDEVLTTPFGRRLPVDERKAQNYLLQSTTSDQVIENAYKIQKILKGSKSTIAFMLHDSIILDMAQEDAIMLKEIKNQFEKTRWGKFKSTCKIGKDFGNLKELNI